jgi:hypothetical protein
LPHQRGKKQKNKTIQNKKNTTKCPKFKCNTVSVSFSACSCSSVVVSSKEERKKESGDSPVNGYLLLEALFMQISGVSLTLTWPLRPVGATPHCYKLSPFQAY